MRKARVSGWRWLILRRRSPTNPVRGSQHRSDHRPQKQRRNEGKLSCSCTPCRTGARQGGGRWVFNIVWQKHALQSADFFLFRCEGKVPESPERRPSSSSDCRSSWPGLRCARSGGGWQAGWRPRQLRTFATRGRGTPARLFRGTPGSTVSRRSSSAQQWQSRRKSPIPESAG